ncbi:hypothetical protein DYB34_008636 [Aphanomyces astaci]|uniref:Transposase Tc1-like domain-containing protein n=1 Tax=Aphanomyces astaci TaxID=112090 RepID=A0A3R6XBS4_APHAT|nr:hypothetical protein DYB34_008636 [Aphanomyces astaci]
MVRSATGRELMDDERTALYHRLLQLKKNGRVSSGDIKELMRTFHVSQQTISHILLRGCQMAAETGCAKRTRRRHKCAVVPTIKLPFIGSCNRGIPKTSLWNLLQANKLRRRTTRVKPMLSVKQKSDRFKFVKKFVQAGHGWSWTMCTHLDEKWFYITQFNRRFYLWHDEPIPQRKVQSKRHITKVTFLCAVTRPRFDFGRRVIWDGKIGLWPIVETKVAARRSKNRDQAFKLEGDNVYKLPHLKKDVQLKSGTVALRPPCDEDVTLALDALESRLDDEHLVDEIVGMLGPALNIVDDA